MKIGNFFPLNPVTKSQIQMKLSNSLKIVLSKIRQFLLWFNTRDNGHVLWLKKSLMCIRSFFDTLYISFSKIQNFSISMDLNSSGLWKYLSICLLHSFLCFRAASEGLCLFEYWWIMMWFIILCYIRFDSSGQALFRRIKPQFQVRFRPWKIHKQG